MTHSLAVINLTGFKNQNQFLMLGTGFLENLTLYIEDVTEGIDIM